MRRYSSYSLIAGTLLLSLVVSGCKQATTVVQSNWGSSQSESRQALLDRSYPMTYLEDQRIDIALQNDADNLYLTLRTADKNIRRQVKYGGLIVWFDKTGEGNKSFGIQYPVGSTFDSLTILDMRHTNKPEKKNEKSQIDSSKTSKLPGEVSEPLVNLNEVHILGPDKNILEKYAAHDLPNFSVSLTDTLGMLIYMLKAPLKGIDDSLLAMGALPGGTIGLGFESDPFMRNLPPPDTLGNAPPHEPGIYGRPQTGFDDNNLNPPKKRLGMRSEPIGFWVKVKLASQGAI